MTFYAVIDTNVLLSALLTKNPQSATVSVVKAILKQELIPLYHADILHEYDEVLHRKKFSLYESEIRNILSMICQFGLEVSPTPTGMILPDMDDLIFYEVVMEKRNETDAYLITGNQKHFPDRSYIVTPAEMMAILENDKNNPPPDA